MVPLSFSFASRHFALPPCFLHFLTAPLLPPRFHLLIRYPLALPSALDESEALSLSPSPPVVVALVEHNAGGELMLCELRARLVVYAGASAVVVVVWVSSATSAPPSFILCACWSTPIAPLSQSRFPVSTPIAYILTITARRPTHNTPTCSE